MKLNVLVLYERSGVIREEFRKRGHDARSCDILDAEDGSDRHFTLDLDAPGSFHALRLDGQEYWDLVIAHPECTDLSVSGAHRFKEKIADGRQQRAIDAFMRIARLPVPRLAIENPVCIMSTQWRQPDQIIQPYQFGHDASKKTCLWLENLPKLMIDPRQHVAPRWVCGTCDGPIAPAGEPENCRKCGRWAKKLPRWANQTDSGQNRLGPSETRSMDRARTYKGIAEAMADQWGTEIWTAIKEGRTGKSNLFRNWLAT